MPNWRGPRRAAPRGPGHGVERKRHGRDALGGDAAAVTRERGGGLTVADDDVGAVAAEPEAVVGVVAEERRRPVGHAAPGEGGERVVGLDVQDD